MHADDVFALLDDARAAGEARSRLYSGHAGTLRCEDAAGWPPLLEALQDALGRGLYAVPLLSYELGAHLDGLPAHRQDGPLAQVLLFTTFDVKISTALEPLRRRIVFYNDAVRELARQYGCLLVDHTQFREFDDPRMWAFDRIHMSRLGHKHLAAYVLAELGIPHTLKLPELPPFEAPHWRESIRTESRWLATEVIPLFRRRINGVREGDTLPPKWPEPIRPADGMKRLARARAGDAVEVRARAGERHAG